MMRVQVDGSVSSLEVVVDWVISKPGRPEQMRVVKSCGSSRLDRACLKAVETTFEPSAL